MDVNKMAVQHLDQRILLTVQVLFCPMCPDIQRSLLCIKFPHPAPARPSSKCSIKMNVSTEHWRNDKWQGRLKHSQKTPVSLIICHHKPYTDLLNSIRVSAARSRSNRDSMSDQNWYSTTSTIYSGLRRIKEIYCKSRTEGKVFFCRGSVK